MKNNRTFSRPGHYGICERVASEGTRFSNDLRTLFAYDISIVLSPPLIIRS